MATVLPLMKPFSLSGDLLHDLLHLALRQRHFIEPILPAIVLEKNLRPVRPQVRLARVLDDLRVALTALAQLVNDGGFEVGFFGESGHCY